MGIIKLNQANDISKGEKVYWVNGWPNNGLGYFVKIKRNGKSVVKDRSGTIVYADKTIPLAKALKQKKDNFLSHGDLKNLRGRVREIMEGNKDEIEEMEKFILE